MKILNSMKKSQLQKCLKVKNYNLEKKSLLFFNFHTSLLYALENLLDSLLDLGIDKRNRGGHLRTNEHG